MANVIVLGAGLAGTAAAYGLRAALGKDDSVTLVGDGPRFQFTPSNPWLALGSRRRDDIGFPIAGPMARHGIRFVDVAAEKVCPETNHLRLADGRAMDYDYLVITTGPRLAFDEVPGLGPGRYTHSICTAKHAQQAWEAYQAFLCDPGPIVVGAAPGASCFGPAYEFALLLDTDLRRRGLRDRVPITYVTSEPYIGHLGLGGVGDSKGLLEHELRQRDIRWIANARILGATSGALTVQASGGEESTLPFRFAMVLPAFTGVDALRDVKELTNARGFVLIDEFQRNPRFRNVYAAGVCVAIPPVEATPVPTGAPKTGFMIESMVTAIVHNLRDDIAGRPLAARATWNAVCLADMGDRGAAFVALPQIPPRNVTWAKEGLWVHLAKVAFEKYYLHKIRTGHTEPVYETHILRLLGIERLKPVAHAEGEPS